MTDFIFYVAASSGKELHAKIKNCVEAYFPAAEWMQQLKEVCQAEQVIEEGSHKKRNKNLPEKVLFQITVEIYPVGLKNALVSKR